VRVMACPRSTDLCRPAMPVALVSGATHGLGHALAFDVAREG
jgi:NADP-dependent 3-hydroxy acid dehydrogenase YdfG